MKNIQLYHGSRTGIIGPIQPKSRPNCDFGSGFYMGTKIEQVRSLIYNEKNPMLYTIDLHLENIPDNRILTLSGMDWAFYVLYNRNKLEKIKKSQRETTLKIENLEKKSGTIDASIINRIKQIEERISGAEDSIENIDTTIKENEKCKRILTQNI